jgi:DNA repair protein RadC
LGPIDIERVRVVYLNSHNMLIRDELSSEGSIDRSAICVREIIERALEPGTSPIIRVQNRANGSPELSRQDIAIPREIADVASRLDIALHHHIVLRGSELSSFCVMGFL